MSQEMLTQSQIIQEIHRLPIAEKHWDENFTRLQKEELLRKVQNRIEAAEDVAELSVMIFDALYSIKGREDFQKGQGLLGQDLEVQETKREKRKRRKAAKLLASNLLGETKTKNNPLQDSKDMVRSSHGSTSRINKREDNTMILINSNDETQVFRFKIRSKGAPKYAETGDNRKVTIDGEAFNFVMNPKEENNTSKRVGFAKDGNWYFVDDADVHTAVKAFDPKKVTKFTQKQRAAKAEKPAKEVKAEKPAKEAKKPAAKKPAAKKEKAPVEIAAEATA